MTIQNISIEKKLNQSLATYSSVFEEYQTVLERTRNFRFVPFKALSDEQKAMLKLKEELRKKAEQEDRRISALRAALVRRFK